MIRLLDFHHIDITGKETVVIGRSPTVGKPLAHLLTCRNATVKICHTFTHDLAASLQQAQLICSAAGKAGLLHSHNVPAGGTVIDIATISKHIISHTAITSIVIVDVLMVCTHGQKIHVSPQKPA